MKYYAFLTLLISSLAITGISFIDDQIWNVIFYVIGVVSYLLVGCLFSIGILSGKQAGRDAYIFVSIVLVVGAFGVYRLLEMFKNWVLSWPLFVKIIIPSVLLLGICLIVIMIIRKKIKKEQTTPVKE